MHTVVNAYSRLSKCETVALLQPITALNSGSSINRIYCMAVTMYTLSTLLHIYYLLYAIF